MHRKSRDSAENSAGMLTSPERYKILKFSIFLHNLQGTQLCNFVYSFEGTQDLYSFTYSLRWFFRLMLIKIVRIRYYKNKLFS